MACCSLRLAICTLVPAVVAMPWSGARALARAVPEIEDGNLEMRSRDDSPKALHRSTRSLHRPINRSISKALHHNGRSFRHPINRSIRKARVEPSARLSSRWPVFAAPRKRERDVEEAVEQVEEETEEVAEETEKYEQYEKRRWLHVLESRTFFDWAVFAVFAVVFLWIYHMFFIGLPAATKFHGFAIVGWVCLGMLYNSFMYMKFGAEQAMVWFNGYLLELIFSLENVFVFHAIIESFGTTTEAAQKCLFLVVCCQIFFELVLYMGLADVINELGFLHYVLGAWLTYLGIHVAFDSDDHSGVNMMDNSIVRAFRKVLGSRLDLASDNTSIFKSSSEGLKLTLLGLAFVCLVGADFVLEIDVTLTKIEKSHDEYLSFTSSALAGFAVPELFFVARDLFRSFKLLKYGISFVLLFYGTDLLFPGVFTMTPIQGCCLIVAIMLLCMLLSICLTRHLPAEEDALLKDDANLAADYGTNETASMSPNRFWGNISRLFPCCDSCHGKKCCSQQSGHCYDARKNDQYDPCA